MKKNVLPDVGLLPGVDKHPDGVVVVRREDGD